MGQCLERVLEQAMEKLGNVFRQRHLARLKILRRFGKHGELQAIAGFENVRGAEADHHRNRHRQSKKTQGGDPYPVHFLIGAQIGDANDNRRENQGDQHHAQQVEKERADQLGAIKRVRHHRCRPSAAQPPATGDADQAADQNLAV